MRLMSEFEDVDFIEDTPAFHVEERDDADFVEDIPAFPVVDAAKEHPVGTREILASFSKSTLKSYERYKKLYKTFVGTSPDSEEAVRDFAVELGRTRKASTVWSALSLVKTYLRLEKGLVITGGSAPIATAHQVLRRKGASGSF